MSEKTIKTIESIIWSEPDEKHRVKEIGMRKGSEVFEELKKHLEKRGLLPDEYFLMNSRFNQNTILPNFHKAVCSVDFGSSEGIYLDITLSYRNAAEQANFMNFATGKTLGTTVADFCRMSIIAGECSMMLNGNGCTLKNNAETLLILDSEETQAVKNALLTQAVFNEDNNRSNETIYSVLNQTGCKEQQNTILDDDEGEMEV